MNANQAKKIKIADYLQSIAITPQKVRGSRLWYCSPFRQEQTPSFVVDNCLNVWYDHGAGCGGNLLDLVMKLHNLFSISAALKHLDGTAIAKQAASFSFQQPENSSGITDVKTMMLANSLLLSYIQSRSISIELAKLYCTEVHYKVKGKKYFAVGFKNDKGGYELSNPLPFKGTISPKSITTFSYGNNTCVLFEGFWDFLSYLMMKNARKPLHDIVVLNSVANLPKTFDFLQHYQTVYACLDNDEAGRKAMLSMADIHDSVIDCSRRYAGYKDLNDNLCNRE